MRESAEGAKLKSAVIVSPMKTTLSSARRHCYLRGMKQHVFTFLIAVLTSAQQSFACYPDPQFDYDDVGSQAVSIVTAKVSAVDFRKGDSQSCWHVSYSGASYLHGKGESEFSVTTCTSEVYQIEMLAQEVEGLDYLGFVEGAEVLIGVAEKQENRPELRYAIPSCWGPLHVNLSKFSRVERKKFVQDVLNQVTSKQ